jgi:hypothetical protein
MRTAALGSLLLLVGGVLVVLCFAFLVVAGLQVAPALMAIVGGLQQVCGAVLIVGSRPREDS